MNLAELGAWLDVLRSRGVKRFESATDPGLPIVEFYPPTAALEVAGPKSIAQALSDLESTDKCKCGHTEAAHNAEGECLQGCELEVCYPGNELPPKPEATLEG